MYNTSFSLSIPIYENELRVITGMLDVVRHVEIIFKLQINSFWANYHSCKFLSDDLPI